MVDGQWLMVGAAVVTMYRGDCFDAGFRMVSPSTMMKHKPSAISHQPSAINKKSLLRVLCTLMVRRRA